MASDDAGGYRLTPGALADLDDLWLYSAQTWTVAQADRYIDDLTQIFATIAAMPELAREYAEFTPPVRIHAHHNTLIVHTIAVDHIIVLRLLGGKQDWMAILKAADS